MLIGIFSDTHDHLSQIHRALAVFEERRVSAVLYAGDLVSPFSADLISQITVPLYAVFGNNEAEQAGIRKYLPDIKHGTIEFAIGKLNFAMAHDFSLIPGGARKKADVLVAGHSHVPLVQRKKTTLWVNPGECCGWVKGRSTVAVLDTKTLDVDIVDLDT